MTETIANFATEWIGKGGYGAVALLMALESMILPVPSEAIMPFAGFHICDGRFTFPGVIFFSTLGSLFGSLLSYIMGFYGGRAFVVKYGKYLLLNLHHLESTERFFAKYGDKTILICRLIPVVRHLISIPAGVGRMNLLKFCLYTIVGAAMWNGFLAWVGFHLKDNYEEVMEYSHSIDLVVVGSLGLAVAYFIYRQRKRRRNSREQIG